MRKWKLLIVLLTITLTSCSKDIQEVKKAEKKTTIRIMHYWGDTDTDESSKNFNKIIDEEFAEAFPNVNLIQDIYDNQTYKKKIKILMASDEVPDIMFGYGGGFSEAFAESGKLLALDNYIDDYYKDRMDMNMQENFIYDGSQYGICFSYWVGVLYCNKSLFEQTGAAFPQTYDELLDVCRKFREKDIQPIACGMLDKWPGQQWINNYTIQLGGAELYKKMAGGEESLDNELLAKSANLVQGLIRSNAFCDNMYDLTSSAAEEMFLEGEAAMIYIGNWYTCAAEERLGEKLAVMKMPMVPDVQYPYDYHGGGINGWMVSSETEYPELATQIVEWISYRLSCYQPQTATFAIDEKDQVAGIGGINEEILNLYKNKENSGCAWDTLMRPERADIWLELCGQLYDLKFNGKGFVKLLKSQIDWRMNS